MTTIYKICTASEWRDAERTGVYRGSAADLKDGFIHFSTAEQAAETAAKWFAGQRDLVLLAIDADALGDKLKWEPKVNLDEGLARTIAYFDGLLKSNKQVSRVGR